MCICIFTACDSHNSGPSDNSAKEGSTPPRKGDNSAKIDRDSLSLIKLDSIIPSQEIIVNEEFSNLREEHNNGKRTVL